MLLRSGYATRRLQIRQEDEPWRARIHRAGGRAIADIGLGGLSMFGIVARIGADHAGLVFNVRFDRADGDWSRVDRWVEALAPCAYER